MSGVARGAAVVHTVVKIGGGLVSRPGRTHGLHGADLDAVLETVALRRPACAILVVPGGGPFADCVRTVDRALGLSESAAHWMAILGMDQYATLLVDRCSMMRLADGPDQIAASLAEGWVPVLQPSGWLRAADPLPHSWEVTSDSLAAWVAGELGARRLVLVKPTDARDLDGGALDSYLEQVLQSSPDLELAVVSAAALDELRRLL